MNCNLKVRRRLAVSIANPKKELDVIKIIGTGLIAVIIILILKQYRPEFAIYVSIGAGVLIFALIAGKLLGIIEILQNLADKASVNNEFIVLLIKITGIAILTEFAASICKDSGESAIASKIDFGGKVVIMSLSIPILSSLLQTIINILP